MVKKIKNYDILDLVKFILSMMIVAVHTSLFPKVLYPWLRLAVPLFFVISSFLLFTKINNSPKEDSKKIIRNFIFRELKLYLFWFIVLLPITLYIRNEWFNSGLLGGIHEFLKGALFSSTFIASWFITASITATYIIYKASNKISNKIIFLVALLCHIVCCFVSSYYVLFSGPLITKISNIYSFFFPTPIFGFPAALIYIFIGKMFADGKLKNKFSSHKVLIEELLILIILCILLFGEWKYVDSITGICTTDCYFLLPPIVLLIFKFLLNINIHLKHSKILRNMSTITFPLHASIARIIHIFGIRYIQNETSLGVINFIVTLSICYLICFLIFKLENKGFRILKYSH